MPEDCWEFWIDVGGTFTDCIARRSEGASAARTMLRCKVLSSGITKGQIASGSSTSRIVDPARCDDPADFWNGYRLRLLDADGETVCTAAIESFDCRGGALQLAAPLATSPLIGQAYELDGGEEAPILAIRYLLRLRRDEQIPEVNVRLGTTRGTNALITRRGAKTALVTTAGFEDILRIGYQNRPRLFDLAIRKPSPLFCESIGIDERLAADGEVLKDPDADEIRRRLAEMRERGVESLAICLLHAFEHPRHEQLVEQLAREIGFTEISTSSRVAPLIKIVSRGDTTVMDAYLNPVLRAYVSTLRESLGESSLRIMTSAGGLVAAEQFVGKDSILSGPAGGVVGFSRAAEAAGLAKAIGFDMGGTSTDVSRYDGRWELEYETEKAGVRVVAPMMAIETVAAGGGSVCGFDGVKLTVGPDSAGADPGPACYGRGGPLAMTDVNLILGKIPTERFPFPLDAQIVRQRLTALGQRIGESTGADYDPIQLADGYLRVANAHMAKAIRGVSVAKGYDPRDYVLVAFGGAAGQHACAIARELGMRQVLIHPDAGVLSAYGIGQADVVRHRAAPLRGEYSEQAVRELQSTFERMAQEAGDEVLAEGIARDRIDVRRSLDLRYQGMDACLTILQPETKTYAEGFAAAHQRLYGYVHAERELELVAARLEVVGRTGQLPKASRRVTKKPARGDRPSTLFFDAAAHVARVYDRDRLRPGDHIRGPVVICEAVATTVVDPGWQAEVLSGGELLLSDMGSGEPPRISTEADPVALEIFNNQFAGIAEQMGIVLKNTASSVNVKERLDFSCAIFTSTGDLVVNAPHIPVHLGAMSETVKRLIADNPVIRPGEVFVTNDPYRGGSHLPDVTVVTPVHHGESGRLLFFTASRAHHAEIGGTSPGSMPPASTNLAEEGVLIRNFKLVDAGGTRHDELARLLASGLYPSRAVNENLADVAAQAAANNYGARQLAALEKRCSWPVVEAYMRHIQTAAETKMRRAINSLPDGCHRFTDHLDDGSPIAVAVTIHRDNASIDFTGTGGVLPGNLNANRAIVSAAVMYCLRCLIDEDIPLNQGVLAPVEIVLPECLLNPPERDDPRQSAAVAGGNVETSQRVVDALLGALHVAAASQGTMNNLLLGDATFGYYETICGGAGATADHDGADAVQTHMTNTRLTDPEVIERRYPVRVREFSIRRGSGGAGRRRGGDGVVRRLEFLQPLEVSLLTGRRGTNRPYGLAGGHGGAAGNNRLVAADGTEEILPALAQRSVHPGDVLIIETPGGGGYGAA